MIRDSLTSGFASPARAGSARCRARRGRGGPAIRAPEPAIVPRRFAVLRSLMLVLGTMGLLVGFAASPAGSATAPGAKPRSSTSRSSAARTHAPAGSHGAARPASGATEVENREIDWQPDLAMALERAT